MNIRTIFRYIFCKDKTPDYALEICRVQTIKRLKYALSPILRHADAPDTAPPLRLSIGDCRKIKEKVDG